MSRVTELIEMFEKAECPSEYEKCPLYPLNDCDNYCPFTEAAEMLADYERLKKKIRE